MFRWVQGPAYLVTSLFHYRLVLHVAVHLIRIYKLWPARVNHSLEQLHELHTVEHWLVILCKYLLVWSHLDYSRVHAIDTLLTRGWVTCGFRNLCEDGQGID